MLSNCVECNKPFVRQDSSRRCYHCTVEEQVLLERVSVCLLKRPGSTVQELSVASGAPLAKLHRLIREGKIQIGATSASACTRCDKPLEDTDTSARVSPAKVFCASCSTSLSGQFAPRSRSLTKT